MRLSSLLNMLIVFGQRTKAKPFGPMPRVRLA